MKNIRNIALKTIVVLAILFSGHACFELEEDTSSILQMESLPDEGAILATLTPVYRAYWEYCRENQRRQIMGYGSDDCTTWSGGNKEPLRVFDRFGYGDGESADNTWLRTPWDNLWKVVYYSNTLIEGLKTSTADPEVITIADAEARFWRANAYLYLVKGWGNMPIILDGMTPTGEEQRATVLENYLHIEQDLLIAEANLPNPDEVSSIGRASNAAAKVLFADLYMTWSGWPVKDASKYQLAAQKAKEIIDMGYFELLKGDELWLEKNGNSKESVFSLQFSEQENFLNEVPSNTIFHESRGWSDFFPERQFFYEFPEGPRKDWTFYVDIPQRDVKDGVIVDRDPATVPWSESQRKHPMYKKWDVAGHYELFDRLKGFRPYEIYRYAEVLLIYAEASALANGGVATGDAVEAYNQIRRRAAGLPYDIADPSVDVSSATAEEIMQEKAWELAGEFKRWWDLVRTETLSEVVARRDPTEEVPIIKSADEISWKQYIAPIPYQAILTSDLAQNPEGFKIQ